MRDKFTLLLSRSALSSNLLLNVYCFHCLIDNEKEKVVLIRFKTQPIEIKLSPVAPNPQSKDVNLMDI